MSEQAERELMRFAARIAAYERPQAPATMRDAVRASLLAAPIALPRRGPWWSRVASLRPLFAAATIAIVLISAGIPAAGASLSGDPLFGLKRAAEETAVALAFDDGARLEQLVTLSDHRLSELVIASSSRPNALAAATREYLAALDRVAQQLGAITSLPRSDARDAAIARADATSAAHLAQLQALAATLPTAAQPGIQRAIEAQQAVHSKTGGGAPAPALPTAPAQLASPGRGRAPTSAPTRR